MTDEQEKEWREEAKRLKAVSRKDQRLIIAIHRSIADDPKVPKADRDDARERADALEKFLGLTKK